MADVYMHSRMTEDLMRSRNAEIDLKTAFLGAQHSDPMNYVIFHKGYLRFRNYSSRLHDTATKQLHINLVQHVKQHPSRTNYSFLFGFLAHYALDVNIHPYVYHNVGVYDSTNTSTYPWRGLHLKFERSIDAVLFEREQAKPASNLRLTQYYFPSKRVPTDVQTLMKELFAKQFGVGDGDRVYGISVRHMYRTLKYLTTDRFGIKKAIYRVADRFFHKTNLFLEDLSFYNHIEPYDFLNLEHRTWHHPVTNEASNKSVLELYQDALKFANQLLDQVDRYLAGDDIDLSTVFDNLSLNSGVDCDHSQPFQYIQIYRPQNNSK